MATKADRALVKETKTLIKEVEAGDTDHAAWVAIQDRVKQLYRDRTQAEVGVLLGKGDDWVSSVIRWDSARARTPDTWRSGSNKRDEVASKVLRDPIQRKKVIDDLDEETRDELLQDVWKKQDEDAEDAVSDEAKRKHKAWTMEQGARKQVELAFDKLKARTYYYGEVPVNDDEHQELGWIIDLAKNLRGESEIDEALQEMISDAA